MPRNTEWKLRDLFEIYYNTTPHVVLLHRGHTHKFMGDYKEQDALIDFAIETFHESTVREKVASMPTFFEELKDLFNYSAKHKNGIVSAMLMQNDEGEIYYSALFGVYILPLLVVWGLYKLMNIPFTTDENTVERTLVLEETNRIEK